MRLLALVVVVSLSVGTETVAAQAAAESPFTAERVTPSFTAKHDRAVAASASGIERDSRQRNLANSASFELHRTTAKAERSSVRFAKLLLPATAGALAGSIAGYKGGDAVGFGGTEEDGLQSAVLLGTGLGLVGTLAGSWLVLGGDVRPGQMAHGVAIGALGGILGAVIAGQNSGDWNGKEVWLGFSVGQGLVSSLILSQIAPR